LEKQVSDVENEGMVVIIPGLGSEDRADEVEQNIAWIKSQGVPFECWLFVYPTEKEFPLDKTRFAPCQVIRHPGYWLGHVLALPLNGTKKPWVLHMLDSVIPRKDVDLKSLFRIMKANRLGHAAPTFSPGYPAYQSMHDIMFSKPENQVGRVVDFIEFQMDAFSREYFACFQDRIDPVNFQGWGMDQMLPYWCGGGSSGSLRHHGRLGLMDHMTMLKTGHSSYNYDEAEVAHQAFMNKNRDVAPYMPRYVTRGELKAPA